MDNRNYGFKHIDKVYQMMSDEWIQKIVSKEDDITVTEYFRALLEDLTMPEKSRFESSTDNFDSIEDYVYNWLSCNMRSFEEDKVYFLLLASKAYFANCEAYELCYNIQRAIDIIKTMENDMKNAPYEIEDDGLPF